MSNLNAVGIIGSTPHNLAQEDDVISPAADRDIIVDDTRKLIFQIGQFMVMGCKHRFTAQTLFIKDVLNDCPRNTHPVKSRGSAPNFVEQHQTAGGRIFEDRGDLTHLDHKSRLAGCQVIRRTDTGKNPVTDRDLRRLSRNK